MTGRPPNPNIHFLSTSTPNGAYRRQRAACLWLIGNLLEGCLREANTVIAALDETVASSDAAIREDRSEVIKGGLIVSRIPSTALREVDQLSGEYIRST